MTLRRKDQAKLSSQRHRQTGASLRDCCGLRSAIQQKRPPTTAVWVAGAVLWTRWTSAAGWYSSSFWRVCRQANYNVMREGIISASDTSIYFFLILARPPPEANQRYAASSSLSALIALFPSLPTNSFDNHSQTVSSRLMPPAPFRCGRRSGYGYRDHSTVLSSAISNSCRSRSAEPRTPRPRRNGRLGHRWNSLGAESPWERGRARNTKLFHVGARWLGRARLTTAAAPVGWRPAVSLLGHVRAPQAFSSGAE